MTRRYDSFVLRCWRLGDDSRRIEVEHLQTGERTRVAILAAAVDWIGAECGETPVPTLDARGPAGSRG